MLCVIHRPLKIKVESLLRNRISFTFESVTLWIKQLTLTQPEFFKSGIFISFGTVCFSPIFLK